MKDERISKDWKTLYAYPSRLLKLRPGDTGVFVCPPAWRGRLATVCGIWVKANTDWASEFPFGTPWKNVFWTESHADGLKVVRAPLPNRPRARSAPTEFTFKPLVPSSLPETGAPRLDQMVSLWRA
ncbi:hypothetical protein [Variovorax sp. GT1P44]|uniref:hypothetical protein n=1 Tax=Variovorax sp. GT1P44 TaxID=3443742 RepID=UPI003F48F400